MRLLRHKNCQYALEIQLTHVLIANLFMEMEMVAHSSIQATCITMIILYDMNSQDMVKVPGEKLSLPFWDISDRTLQLRYYGLMCINIGMYFGQFDLLSISKESLYFLVDDNEMRTVLT